MFHLNDPYLNHPESMPVALPPYDQLQGNAAQANMLQRLVDPLPIAGSGGEVLSLLVSAAPFPWYVDARPDGLVSPAPLGLMPRPDPPAWLPQGTYKYFGGDGDPSALPLGKV